MPTIGRINSTNDLKIKGEIIETQINDSNFSLDEFGNFYLSNGELIEKIDIADGGSLGVYYAEDTQSELDTGTLTKVNAKSDGTIKLAGETSNNYPSTIIGTNGTGQYGIGFTVNEPIVLNGWKMSSGGSFTAVIELHQDYTWGQNLTGRTPFKTTSKAIVSGVNIVTGLNWEIPVGTYWLGLRTSTSVGMIRNNQGTWGGHPKTSVGGTVTSIKACRYDGYTVGQDNWYYFWEWDLRLNSSGTRITNPIDLSGVTNVSSSVINWINSIPSGSTLTIETSLDGGTSWQSATNGGSIVGINNGDNLTGKTLLIRQNFLLGTSSTSPSLDSLDITINQTIIDTTSTFKLNLNSTDFKVRTLEEGVIF